MTPVKSSSRKRHNTVLAVIRRAIVAGFTVGREVEIGSVPGTVVGFNIADFGDYPASEHPLLIDTPLGVIKSRLGEVRLVRR